MKLFPLMVLVAVLGCSRTNDTASTNSSQEGSSVTERDLADETFHKILKQHGETLNPSALPEQQRNVALVYHAHGIIGNGGFQYLFEGNIPGDPAYKMTREAFKAIGATEACSAFEKAFAVFPNGTPPDEADRRLWR